ncbi:MAG: glycosyltransferase family 4 protein [Flavobacteriales bacterium]
MKLLILTDGITPFVIGGMQKHSQNLARELALQGHSITLFHCVNGKNKLPERDDLIQVFGEKAMQNIESICLRFPAPSWYPGHYIKESYIYSRMLYKRIESRLHEFDFIYAKGFTAWHFIEQKRKGKTLPPIGVKFHGYEMFQPPANFRLRIESYLLQKPVQWNTANADVVFSYGGKITELISSLGVEKSSIVEIPTGIDSNWIVTGIRSSSDDVKHFCFLGRYERRKGIHELHAALRQLREENFHFHFIGPIPQTKQFKHKNVTYHGTLKEPAAIQSVLDTCQVLVTPSHSEGMPNVIMEGMARGLAILATPVGAVPAVVDESNGWLVNSGDTDALAQQTSSILQMTNADIAAKQNASLQRIRQFTWEEIARITLKQIGRFVGTD